MGTLTTSVSNTTNCNGGTGQDNLTATCSSGNVVSGGCNSADYHNTIASSFRSSPTQWSCKYNCTEAANVTAEAYCQ